MITQRDFTLKRILAIALAAILFGIIANTLFAPVNVRDSSGEAYIMIACELAIGSWLLYYGLFSKKKTENDLVQNTNKG